MNYKRPIKKIINKLIWCPKDIAPLITFRILFGALMLFGTVRFVLKGWVEKLYVEPQFFFKFYGFEWVQPFNETGMYLLFGIIALSALCIMIGFYYRLAAIIFFISFTYVELIDATNYLNHYYLICLLGFLMIFLPANRSFSVDVLRNPTLKLNRVPAWTVHIIIFQIALVYTFAGVAKLNGDWLFRAMPLAVWLPEHTDFPLLGYFFQFKWTAYLFCWAGALYDLSISWFLLNKKTRPYAYLAVVLFHLITGLLFNIGLFPHIMICSTLIFFSAEFHHKVLSFIRRPSGVSASSANTTDVYSNTRPAQTVLLFVYFYVFLQIALPLRHHLYPGHLLWTEEGYRFSWRVMLVEKIGQTTFNIYDPKTDRKTEIVNGNYLTLFQEKQMSIQPDFMLQFAQYLKKEYREKHGIENPIITADAHVALNGRTSKRFVDPDFNLAIANESFKAKKWILP